MIRGSSMRMIIGLKHEQCSRTVFVVFRNRVNTVEVGDYFLRSSEVQEFRRFLKGVQECRSAGVQTIVLLA